ncbi:MAG: hypothetical protein RLQ73_00700 [Hoeflea sp. D1-CHI-28]
MTNASGSNDVDVATAQALTGQFIKHAIDETGFLPSTVLVGALSQIAGMIAACYGGDQAAHFLRNTADKVQSQPSMADLDLADMPTSGRV